MSLVMMTFSVCSAAESVLAVPLTLKLDDIDQLIEQHVPTPLYEQKPTERVCIPSKTFSFFGKAVPYWPAIHCEVTIIVERKGDISVSTSADELQFLVPVSGSASLRGVGFLGRKINLKSDIDSVIKANMSPEILNDWHIRSHLKIEYEWVSSPVLKFMDTFELPLAPLINPVIIKFSKNASTQLDAALSDLQIRDVMTTAWDEVQQPIQISTNPMAYLYLTPSSIAIENPTLSNNALRSVVEIKGEVAVIAGSLRELAKTPLPELQVRPISAQGISVKAGVILPYSVLTDAVAQSGKFPIEDKVELDDLEIAQFSVRSPTLTGTATRSVSVLVPGTLSTGESVDTAVALNMTISLQIDKELGRIIPNVGSANLLLDDQQNSDVLFDLLFGHVAELVEADIALPYRRYIDDGLKELGLNENRQIALNEYLAVNTSVTSVELQKLELLTDHVSLTASIEGAAELSSRE